MMEVYKIDMLPPHMREGVKMWLEHGVMTGHFLTAVMNNDLVEAFGAADIVNTNRMREWASWLYNYAPAECWGSRENVEKWRAHGGLSGKTTARDPRLVRSEEPMEPREAG